MDYIVRKLLSRNYVSCMCQTMTLHMQVYIHISMNLGMILGEMSVYWDGIRVDECMNEDSLVYMSKERI